MLIRNAEVWGRGIADVRLAGGVIAAIGALPPRPGEPTIEAHGGALLPGLHDHHIHLASLAARSASIVCGPPQVTGVADLARALDLPGSGWLRGIGYHESVMGLPDASALDELVAARPIRIQHRSGRMWLLNSRGLAELLARTAPPPGLERVDGRFTGRLFDADDWLRAALSGTPPELAPISCELARLGVTGVTDMSPRNGEAEAAYFAREVASGGLAQRLVLAGSEQLSVIEPQGWALGPTKLHLHEAALPDFTVAAGMIRRSHRAARPIAVHCVSEVELVFTVALFEAAGTILGDRIEHASVASEALADRIAALGLRVCVQPHFIAERGDRYLADVEPRHHADLYRLSTLASRGITLAGGSDAPFGDPDPWAAMRAAVTRTTRCGAIVGADEALSAEAALDLFLRDPLDLALMRRIGPGLPADLCLLDRPWAQARERLCADDVLAVWASGRLIHQRVDQAPVERLASAEALA